MFAARSCGEPRHHKFVVLSASRMWPSLPAEEGHRAFVVAASPVFFLYPSFFGGGIRDGTRRNNSLYAVDPAVASPGGWRHALSDHRLAISSFDHSQRWRYTTYEEWGGARQILGQARNTLPGHRFFQDRYDHDR